MKRRERIVGIVIFGAILAVAMLACQKKPAAPPKVVNVEAVLPLTGADSADGRAFREGFERVLTKAFGGHDSLRLNFTVRDNASSPDTSAAIVARTDSSVDCVVAGIGDAVADVPAPRHGLGLWVGAGDIYDTAWKRATPSAEAIAQVFWRWCRQAPRPVAVLFPAAANWAPMVQEHLVDLIGADSVIVIPHDVGEAGWSREAARLQSRGTRSALLWDSPEEARSLLARPDLQSLWARIPVLGPEGAGTHPMWVLPWEPSPSPEEHEVAQWHALGEEMGAKVAVWLHRKTVPEGGWATSILIRN